MAIDCKKESLCMHHIVDQANKTFVVEGDTIIPDSKPDILSAIHTTGNVCVYKKEILDGKLRMDGSLSIHVMYLAETTQKNEVRGFGTNLDFTEVWDLEKARTGMNSTDTVQIKNIECQVLNGRKIHMKAEMEIQTTIYSNENVSFVQKVEGVSQIQKLSRTRNVYSLIGEGSTKVFAKDNIKLDETDEVAEILKLNVCIQNKEMKISYHKVLAKADLAVKILYLTEDNHIGLATGSIPVMGFVDMQNVEDNSICDMNYTLKNLVYKMNTPQEHSIFVEAEIGLECLAYESKSLELIEDMYSPCENMVLTRKNRDVMTGKERICETVPIKQQIQMPELQNHRVYDVEIQPLIEQQTVANQQIVIDGIIAMNILFEGEEEGSFYHKKTSLSFQHKITTSQETMENRQVTVEVQQSDFVVQNGSIDCNIQLKIQVDTVEHANLSMIDQVEIAEEEPKDNFSMVVYFVKKGDTLWKIAKQFRSTVEEIKQVNQIEDEKNLLVGTQLFIPKYVKKKLA